MAAESYAEAARKAAGGSWRKPRMKIYDYNQEFGGNYYQPMIQYIYKKEIDGPYHERKAVYLPDRAEVTSNKYSNMRYDDHSPTDLDLDNFLTRAYKKQIRDLNSDTASAHRLIAHNSKDDTFFTGQELLGLYVESNNDRRHYTRELASVNRMEHQRMEEAEAREAQLKMEREMRNNPQIRHERWQTYGYLRDPWDGSTPVPLPNEPIDEATKEKIKDVRAKLYWIYKPRTVPELKQWLE